MSLALEVPFTGSTERAFDLALTTLTGHGFGIDEESADVLTFSGPGLMSTRQSPLLGATWLRLARVGSNLQLEADLGGVRRMRKFLVLFPPGLALFLLAVFQLIPGFNMQVAVIAAVASISPWIVLTPLFSVMIQKRTVRSLEVLLQNLAAAGERQASDESD